jgi:hypothetical protein
MIRTEKRRTQASIEDVTKPNGEKATLQKAKEVQPVLRDFFNCKQRKTQQG